MPHVNGLEYVEGVHTIDVPFEACHQWPVLFWNKFFEIFFCHLLVDGNTLRLNQ
jgi:hypothetical protein